MRLATDTRWPQMLGRVLGDELRRERKNRGWFRHDLRNHLGTDLSTQTLATYELGTRRLSVIRLIEITDALDVSVFDILHRTYDRVFDDTETIARTIDLHTASQIHDPTLAPLQSWAACRLHTSLPNDTPTTVQLDEHALQPLAALCGLDRRELLRRLPRSTRNTP